MQDVEVMCNVPCWRTNLDLVLKSENCTNCTSREMGLYPLWDLVVFWGLTVDPAVAKFAPWLKLDPTESM